MGRNRQHGTWVYGKPHVTQVLEVPELRFNRAEIVLGDKWRSPGAGIIESVEPDYDADGNLLRSGTISLKLQDGEIGAVAVDDICMGYFHDYETPGNNAVSDIDDSRGNRMFAGFCTIYFRITEILDAGTNKRFRYVLRGVSDVGNILSIRVRLCILSLMATLQTRNARLPLMRRGHTAVSW